MRGRADNPNSRRPVADGQDPDQLAGAKEDPTDLPADVGSSAHTSWRTSTGKLENRDRTSLSPAHNFIASGRLDLKLNGRFGSGLEPRRGFLHVSLRLSTGSTSQSPERSADAGITPRRRRRYQIRVAFIERPRFVKADLAGNNRRVEAARSKIRHRRRCAPSVARRWGGSEGSGPRRPDFGRFRRTSPGANPIPSRPIKSFVKPQKIAEERTGRNEVLLTAHQRSRISAACAS
jgi:hypothetical protein